MSFMMRVGGQSGTAIRRTTSSANAGAVVLRIAAVAVALASATSFVCQLSLRQFMVVSSIWYRRFLSLFQAAAGSCSAIPGDARRTKIFDFNGDRD